MYIYIYIYIRSPVLWSASNPHCVAPLTARFLLPMAQRPVIITFMIIIIVLANMIIVVSRPL